MQYTTTIEIERPRDEVIALFVDQDNYPQWQDTLVRREHIEGEPGQEGLKTRLLHQMGKRQIEMVETIVKSELPELFVATYTSKGVYNEAVNRFVAVDDKRTAWTMDTVFSCKGMMWLMTTLMPGMFKKQTRATMSAFRDFAESKA